MLGRPSSVKRQEERRRRDAQDEELGLQVGGVEYESDSEEENAPRTKKQVQKAAKVEEQAELQYEEVEHADEEDEMMEIEAETASVASAKSIGSMDLSMDELNVLLGKAKPKVRKESDAMNSLTSIDENMSQSDYETTVNYRRQSHLESFGEEEDESSEISWGEESRPRPPQRYNLQQMGAGVQYVGSSFSESEEDTTSSSSHNTYFNKVTAAKPSVVVRTPTSRQQVQNHTSYSYHVEVSPPIKLADYKNSYGDENDAILVVDDGLVMSRSTRFDQSVLSPQKKNKYENQLIKRKVQENIKKRMESTNRTTPRELLLEEGDTDELLGNMTGASLNKYTYEDEDDNTTEKRKEKRGGQKGSQKSRKSVGVAGRSRREDADVHLDLGEDEDNLFEVPSLKKRSSASSQEKARSPTQKKDTGERSERTIAKAVLPPRPARPIPGSGNKPSKDIGEGESSPDRSTTDRPTREFSAHKNKHLVLPSALPKKEEEQEKNSESGRTLKSAKRGPSRTRPSGSTDSQDSYAEMKRSLQYLKAKSSREKELELRCLELEKKLNEQTRLHLDVQSQLCSDIEVLKTAILGNPRLAKRKSGKGNTKPQAGIKQRTRKGHEYDEDDNDSMGAKYKADENRDDEDEYEDFNDGMQVKKNWKLDFKDENDINSVRTGEVVSIAGEIARESRNVDSDSSYEEDDDDEEEDDDEEDYDDDEESELGEGDLIYELTCKLNSGALQGKIQSSREKVELEKLMQLEKEEAEKKIKEDILREKLHREQTGYGTRGLETSIGKDAAGTKHDSLIDNPTPVADSIAKELQPVETVAEESRSKSPVSKRPSSSPSRTKNGIEPDTRDSEVDGDEDPSLEETLPSSTNTKGGVLPSHFGATAAAIASVSSIKAMEKEEVSSVSTNEDKKSRKKKKSKKEKKSKDRKKKKSSKHRDSDSESEDTDNDESLESRKSKNKSDSDEDGSNDDSDDIYKGRNWKKKDKKVKREKNHKPRRNEDDDDEKDDDDDDDDENPVTPADIQSDDRILAESLNGGNFEKDSTSLTKEKDKSSSSGSESDEEEDDEEDEKDADKRSTRTRSSSEDTVKTSDEEDDKNSSSDSSDDEEDEDKRDEKREKALDVSENEEQDTEDDVRAKKKHGGQNSESDSSSSSDSEDEEKDDIKEIASQEAPSTSPKPAIASNSDPLKKKDGKVDIRWEKDKDGVERWDEANLYEGSKNDDSDTSEEDPAKTKKNAQEEDDIWMAAKRGDLRAVKKFFKQGQPLDEVDERGIDPEDETWLGKLFLSASKYTSGNTPLFWACAKGHKDVVEFLLENGAKDKSGVCCEAAGKDSEILELMKEYGFQPLKRTEMTDEDREKYEYRQKRRADASRVHKQEDWSDGEEAKPYDSGKRRHSGNRLFGAVAAAAGKMKKAAKKIVGKK